MQTNFPRAPELITPIYTGNSPLSRVHHIAFSRLAASRRSRQRTCCPRGYRRHTYRNAHTYVCTSTMAETFVSTPVYLCALAIHGLAFEIEITGLSRLHTRSDLDHRCVPLFISSPPSFPLLPFLALSFFLAIHPRCSLELREYAWVIWRAARTNFKAEILPTGFTHRRGRMCLRCDELFILKRWERNFEASFEDFAVEFI